MDNQLSKRELMAVSAMQSLLSNADNRSMSTYQMAEKAVKSADALIKALAQ